MIIKSLQARDEKSTNATKNPVICKDLRIALAVSKKRLENYQLNTTNHFIVRLQFMYNLSTYSMQATNKDMVLG